jgi:NCK-associated protein 1
MSYMHHQDTLDMFKNVLLNSNVHVLYRDDCVQTHSYLLQLLETAKSNPNAKKLIEVVRETQSIQNSRLIHRDKRQYLRQSLKELCLLFQDQPGLLGPKASDAFLALSMARDEVNWLLRHQFNNLVLTKQAKTLRGARKDDWIDKQLPELLFYIEELRGLVRKYAQIIQKYYTEYLGGANLRFLDQKLHESNGLPLDEEELLNSFSRTLSNLHNCGDNFDGLNFKALRLDWFRFQTYTSINKSHTFSLIKHNTLARLINTISYQSKLVDSVEEMLMDTSDLSIFCFYPQLFFDNFHLCFEYPHQLRYSIAFPLICSHFINCTHELCPEEVDIFERFFPDYEFFFCCF